MDRGVLGEKDTTFYVYIIESESTGQRYVGQTCDLEKRITQHNSHSHKPSKYTSRHKGPWQLVYYETHSSRSEAMKRERWLKSRSGRRWLNIKLGRASPSRLRRPD
jgi:putative endonuclease